MKILRWIGLTLVAMVVLLFVLLETATRLPIVQEDLARRAKPFMGPRIYAERIAPAFWPGLGVSFKGVRIKSGEAGESQEILTAKEIDLIFAWGPLFAGDFELRMISVDGALLVFSRDADGNSSLSDLVEHVGAIAEQTEQSQNSPMRSLPAIRARDTEVRFTDHYPDGSPSPIVISDVSIDIEASKPGHTAPFHVTFDYGGGTLEAKGSVERDADPTGTADLSIQAQVRGQGLPAGALLPHLLPGEAPKEISGTLGLSLQVSGAFPSNVSGSGTLEIARGGGFEWMGLRLAAPIAFSLDFGLTPSGFGMPKAQIEAAEVAWNRYTGQNLAIAMSYAKGRLDIESARLDFYGSEIQVSGGADFSDAVAFHGTFESKGIQMPELMKALFDTPSEIGFETLDAHFDFEGNYRQGEDLSKQMTADGRMKLEGGELPSGSVIGAVGEGLLSVVPKILRPKGEGGIARPTRVEFLEQTVALRDGSFHVSDLSFVTDDYRLTGGGSIGLDGKIRLHTEIHFTVAGMQKLLVSVAVPIPTGGVDILPPFPVAVRGHISHPIFLPEITHLPFMAVQIVFAPVKGISNLLFGGIKKLGSGLLGGSKPSS